MSHSIPPLAAATFAFLKSGAQTKNFTRFQIFELIQEVVIHSTTNLYYNYKKACSRKCLFSCNRRLWYSCYSIVQLFQITCSNFRSFISFELFFQGRSGRFRWYRQLLELLIAEFLALLEYSQRDIPVVNLTVHIKFTSETARNFMTPWCLLLPLIAHPILLLVGVPATPYNADIPWMPLKRPALRSAQQTPMNLTMSQLPIISDYRHSTWCRRRTTTTRW